MSAPAAPLEKAVEESRKALADARKIMDYSGNRWSVDKWIIGYKGPQESELAGHIIILADALRSLLAALYADRGEAEAALREIRDSPTAVGKDIARRYFARREEKEVPE